MSTAELVSRFINEAWNQGRMAVIAEVMHTPYRAQSLNFGLPVQDALTHAQLEQHVREFRNAFPDLRLSIDEVVESGDRAYVQTRLTGTDRGGFMGAPPTGRSVNFVLSAVYRSRGDKLFEHRVLVDMLGLLQQLGLAPMPGMPPEMPPGAPPGVPPQAPPGVRP